METREYTVSFLTPAFLGDAAQEGCWRTPPFKALLRQWWRVAAAAGYGYDHHALREVEGRLFGHAWLKGDRDAKGRQVAARQSRVRLRLDSWSQGGLDTSGWPGGAMDRVITTRDGKGQVPADVYLGYGPVLPPSKKQGRLRTTIRGALAPGERAQLRVALPATEPGAELISTSLALAHWFGTMGSRCRNAWGSLSLVAQGDTPGLGPAPSSEGLAGVLRDYRRCLAGPDWAHAIGRDERGPLVWRSAPVTDWRRAIGLLARLRVALRRVAKDVTGPGGIGGIHLLGYPAGGQWQLRGVPETARMASSLRFKVVADADGETLRALVLHMPHALPGPFAEAIGNDRCHWLQQNQEHVWHSLHQALDEPARLAEGPRVRADDPLLALHRLGGQ